MAFEHRWQIIDEIQPSGKQASVFRVKKKLYENELLIALTNVGHHSQYDTIQQNAEKFIDGLRDFVKRMSEDKIYVVKKLKDSPSDSKNAERMRREILALQKTKHDNLLQLEDHDKDDFSWFVAEYHSGGTIANEPNRIKYAGKPLEALRAFRPVVEAVSTLHTAHAIHRDIKPDNIFVASDGRLILGDLGLVFFLKEDFARISGASLPGASDWRPQWLRSTNIDTHNPTFDIYALGKVLWSLIDGAGRALVRENYDDEEFDLTLAYKEVSGIELINEILRECVVDKESKCFKSASDLLKLIDRTIVELSTGTLTNLDDPQRICPVCRKGTYQLMNNGLSKVKEYGLQSGSVGHQGMRRTLIFECSQCGNVQFFSWKSGQIPKPWKGIGGIEQG